MSPKRMRMLNIDEDECLRASEDIFVVDVSDVE